MTDLEIEALDLSPSWKLDRGKDTVSLRNEITNMSLPPLICSCFCEIAPDNPKNPCAFTTKKIPLFKLFSTHIIWGHSLFTCEIKKKKKRVVNILLFNMCRELSQQTWPTYKRVAFKNHPSSFFFFLLNLVWLRGENGLIVSHASPQFRPHLA